MSGEVAGILELLADPWAQTHFEARLYAAEQFEINGRHLAEELPNFDDGLIYARKLAVGGTYRRKEMPVIEEEDVADLRSYITGLGGNATVDTVKIGAVVPTQCQVYIDKSVSNTARFGRDGTVKFLTSNHMVTDIEDRIFDGHHRWLTGCTIDSQIEVPRLRIDLPLEHILPNLLAFSDARHPRNA